jgi:ABC-type lipoprotein export system ATPase subunit
MLTQALSSQSRQFISLENIVKVFKTPAGEFFALKNISMGFDQGEFTAIMGKSGSGKSTLINMITGIDHPTSGAVRIGGTELYKFKEGQMAEWRGKNLGIVFQFFQLLPTLSILENTILPMDYCNIHPPAEREKRAHDLLKRLDLDDFADKLPAGVSGGQQQIAAIARSLANDPPIIIADEPTGNLDSRTAELVLNIFEQLAREGKTILIVTHDPILARRATRRVIISDGELVNEDVYHALPTLTHPHMLAITKIVKIRQFATGATIARQGGVDEGLIIISKGKVEVRRNRFMKKDELITSLGCGDCISELDMLEIPAMDITFQAVEGPVEALCISLEQFNKILSEQPAIESALRLNAMKNRSRFTPAKRDIFGRIKEKKQ